MFGDKKILVVLSAIAALTCSVSASECSSQGDFSDYMANLREKIHRTWTPPETLEEGHAIVIFKLDREGNIISKEITQGSGSDVYDESAIEALKKSAPFGAFPENSKRETLTIKYSFDSTIVQGDVVRDYIEKSEQFTNSNNKMALYYLDKAIEAIQGDPACYFLYARRCKIHKAMGDMNSAEIDIAECKKLKPLYDKKRINACKLNVQKEGTPFSYFALANAYDAAGDYPNAIDDLNKAINMTPLNNTYKRYRAEIILRYKNQE